MKNETINMIGWILFIISAIGFTISSIGNFWAMFGSLFFLVACFVFLIPYFKKKDSSIKIKKIDKLSFKFKFELENIPQEIKIMQKDISSLKNELKDTNLYISNTNRFEEVTEKLGTLEKDLENKENRWLELLEMEEAINKENE